MSEHFAAIAFYKASKQMPYKRTRIPKYLILEDNNPPNHRRAWGLTLIFFVLIAVTVLVLF